MRDRKEELEDEILVVQCQDGDHQAFQELIQRWQHRLWRHAARTIGSGDSAWDVVQESWIAIIRGIGRLDDPGAFSTWAYRIVTRRSADWVRQRARQIRLAENLSRRPPRDGTDPDRDEIDALEKAISRLDPDQRAMLSLHYVEGCGIQEVAQILSIPAGTVKSRLHYIRNELKRILEEDIK